MLLARLPNSAYLEALIELLALLRVRKIHSRRWTESVLKVSTKGNYLQALNNHLPSEH